MTDPEVILVIEDHEDVREGIAIALSLHGYAVETAANGLQALLMLEAGLHPCLIVMDLMMPVMSGFEFREKQLADPLLRGIPLIAYSGITDPRETAQHLGAAAYLHKPVDMEVFATVVGQFCPGGARREPSA
jgi:CheY-like chemotaxis protein